MSADTRTDWGGVHPLDWAALIARAEEIRRDNRLGMAHTWEAIRKGDHAEASRRLNDLLGDLGLERHPAQPRCGAPRNNGEVECRTPVARLGYACAKHRRVLFDSRIGAWRRDDDPSTVAGPKLATPPLRSGGAAPVSNANEGTPRND